MDTHWSNQLILGRFRVDIRLPGAEVAYRAWDNQTGRAVILHILPNLPVDEISRQLEERGQALATFSHPAISPYLGYFEFSSCGFWAEGYLDAPTLRDIFGSIPGHPLELKETLTYLKDLSAGLEALHQSGWAHANLCPENIRVSRTGRVMLFGLFSARRLGELPSIAGNYTPADRLLTPAFDVYSLGCVAYEMLAGSLTPPLTDLRTLNPRVPEFLARQLPRALDPYLASRVQSAQEFFLTACLACKIEPASVPERIPLDSASALSLAAWDYLPVLNPPQAPPHTPPVTDLPQPGRTRSVWTWPALAIAILALGLGAWSLFHWLAPPTSPAQPVVTVTPTVAPPALVNIAPAPTASAIPSLSAPDGLSGRIVYTCTHQDLNQLCMVAPTGGPVTRLTTGAAHSYYPAFSPAGNMLLYSSNRGGNFNLYLLLLGSDVLTRLSDDTGEVAASAFSPDGAQIVFTNSVGGKPFELWQVSRQGGDAHRLYNARGSIASAAWAPNGRSIALAIAAENDPTTYDVYILDLATLTSAPLTSGKLPSAGGSVDWSPDGRSLLLFAGPAGDKNIFLFDIVSGHIAQLTKGGNNASPSFSPDGRWVVFNSQRSGNADIFIMRPDGTDVRQLTTDPDPDWQPKWGR